MADKYVIIRLKDGDERCRIMAFSGARRVPSRVVDNREYVALNDAYHPVFILRISDLMER